MTEGNNLSKHTYRKFFFKSNYLLILLFSLFEQLMYINMISVILNKQQLPSCYFTLNFVTEFKLQKIIKIFLNNWRKL